MVLWRRAPRVARVVICVVAAVFVFMAGQGIEVGRKAHWTCAFCRMDKVEKTWMFWSRSRVGPTEFTRWFDKHLNLSHEHNWVRSSCTGTYNIWGLPWGVRCAHGDPVFLIDPHRQVVVFESLLRHGRARAVAQALGRATRKSRRPIVLALKELDAGQDFDSWWANNRQLFERID